MFYSVDVETGSTTPTPGALLTVGVVAVNKINGNWTKVDNLYLHLAYDANTFDEDTITNFWEDEEKVSDQARNEAFNWALNRLHPASAAAILKEFVEKYSEQKESFFAANPASFDHAWVDQLFSTWNVKTPFSHRTLCMRSMQYGIFGGEFGQKREETFKPDVPHHALYDADAQADHLIEMLGLVGV